MRQSQVLEVVLSEESVGFVREKVASGEYRSNLASYWPEQGWSLGFSYSWRTLIVRGNRMAHLDWSQCPIVESVPGKRNGAWVFKNSRMPVATVFENLASGASMDDLVAWFGVTREQVVEVLEFAALSLAAPERAPAAPEHAPAAPEHARTGSAELVDAHSF